jgi:hypothetical protein
MSKLAIWISDFMGLPREFSTGGIGSSRSFRKDTRKASTHLYEITRYLCLFYNKFRL